MTPQYYVLRISGLTAYNDLEDARKGAESIDLSLGEGAAIFVPIGITRRSVTTSWLGKQDIGGACEQANSPATWSWPALPPGHSYLNPENLTVEQLGDGWRPLCTLDDSFPEYHEWRLGKNWRPGTTCGLAPRVLDGCNLTYRTRAPIPTLPSNP